MHTREEKSISNRFLISVAAAALIAGTGFASAQGTGTSREAPAAQQSAPATGGAASGTMKHEESTPSKSSQSEQKSQSGSTAQRSDERTGEKSKMSSDNDKTSKSKSPENAATKSGNKDMKAEGRNGAMTNEKSATDTKSGTMSREKNAAETKSGTMSNEKSASDSKAMERTQTTGQAGAGAKLTTEQRTKISTVIRDQHVAAATNVNFNVSVGTRVPRTVEFHPLPAEVVTIYPQWRGYNFILVKHEIVVIDPATFEIVAVIEA